MYRSALRSRTQLARAVCGLCAPAAEGERMALTAISPLDGRYTAQVQSLAPYFSEVALIHYRVRVELAWLVTLSERPELPHIRPLTPPERQLLETWVTTFDNEQAQAVKET